MTLQSNNLALLSCLYSSTPGAQNEAENHTFFHTKQCYNESAPTLSDALSSDGLSKQVVMNTPHSFSAWLKQRRKSLDLTQADLAHQISCTTSLLQKIESGERRPSRQIAELLAQALGIPPDRRSAFLDFARCDRPVFVFQAPTNLPAPPTPLIGRDQDVAVVRQRLLREDTRLITLIGPPGIGKTRLGLQVARDVRDQFDDGVFFVALAAITDPELVAPAIAQTLGLKESAGRSPLDQLVHHLCDKGLLLLLDNFEQVIPATPVVTQLLSTCALLKIIITSRSALRIRAERQYLVPLLALPDPTRLPGLEILTGVPAIALFADRAEAVNLDFAVTTGNAAAVAAICQRLDGLPLAIELIAAHTAILSPQEILERLRGSWLLRAEGLHDVDARQKTLFNAIEWSYRQLAPDEQQLLTRLSAFVGGWTLEAAEALDGGADEVASRLAALANKSLITRQIHGSEVRFTMLEMIREFAQEQLCASHESDVIRRRHGDWFLQLAMAAEPQLVGPDQMHWLNRLQAEHSNLRKVLNGLIDEGQLNHAAQLCTALRHFWVVHAHLDEGRRNIERVLAGWREPAAAANPAGKARLLNAAGCLTFYQGDYAAARAYFEAAWAVARAISDKHAAAFALDGLGAEAANCDDRPRALTYAQQSLELSRAIGDHWLSAITLITLGEIARLDKGYEQAIRLYTESLTLLRQLGDRWFIAIVLENLGQVAQDQGRYAEAENIHAECLSLCRDLENYRGVAMALEKFASVTVLRGRYERAARLLGAAQAVRAAARTALETGTLDRLDYERCQTLISAGLSEECFTACWAEGRAMTIEQAIGYALEN